MLTTVENEPNNRSDCVQTYFFEDFADYAANPDSGSESVDLNYSFLIKTFSKLDNNQKSKILQVLKNTSGLKETG